MRGFGITDWSKQPRLELRPGFPALAPRLQSSTGGSPTARDSQPPAPVAHLFIYLFLSYLVWPIIFAYLLSFLDCLPIYLFIYSSNNVQMVRVPGLNLWKQYKNKIFSYCQNWIIYYKFSVWVFACANQCQCQENLQKIHSLIDKTSSQAPSYASPSPKLWLTDRLTDGGEV